MALDDHTKKQLDDTIRVLENVIDEAAHDAEATGLAVRKQVRAHPGSAIAIALGAGLVLGAILGRASS